MAWKKKNFPTVKGYESLGDDPRAKRFLDFRINQLLDTADPVWEYRDEFKSREEVCNFVIRQFKYPMKGGRPCDSHYNNWFGSDCCHQISSDYWQQASETLRTLRLNQTQKRRGIGNCEDTSCLFTTLFEEKGWNVYECLGLVYRDKYLLGGHGWPIFEDENGIWRLYESTLDTPPEYPDQYPEIDPSENNWKVGRLTYRAILKFNRNEYYEWGEEKMTTYIELPFEEKNRREKFREIGKAWELPVSPLEERNWLSWFRWRK